MKYTYHVNVFDPNSVINAINEIKHYRNVILPQKLKDFTEALAKEGVTIAENEIVDLDAVFNGDLLNSIHYEEQNGSQTICRYLIKADNEHAIYVEFGTGKIGAENPYKGPVPVIYAQGETIHYLADGRYGWFYPLGNGQWRFTEGMPSRPFMLNTANQLHGIIERVAKQVFG